jgi:hypothetical protein
MNLKIAALATITTTLLGCTPVGQLKESDFVWHERTLPIAYQQAFRNVRAGFRSCGDEYVESALFNDIKTGEFDAWHPTMLNSASPIYWGRIIITAIDEKHSRVRVGLTSDSEARRNRWHRWATGDSGC